MKDLLEGVAITTVEFHTEEGPLSIDNLFVSQLYMYPNNGSIYKVVLVTFSNDFMLVYILDLLFRMSGILPSRPEIHTFTLSKGASSTEGGMQRS